jgi:hypothetical protein
MKLAKILCLCVILASFALQAQAQNQEILMVIFVQGTVRNVDKKQNLKRGMQLLTSDKVIFSKKTDRVIVISNQRGRFILNPKPKSNSEFVSVVYDVLNPFKKNAAISSRGSGDDLVTDLKSYLGRDTLYVIGEKLEIQLNPENYPMTESQSFLYRFNYNKSTLSRSISSSDKQSLLISPENLYQDKNGNAVPADSVQKIEVYFYDKSDGKLDKITQFKPLFLEEAELKETYRLLKKNIKKQTLSQEEKEEYYIGFFRDYYGRTDENILLKKLIQWKIWR